MPFWGREYHIRMDANQPNSEEYDRFTRLVNHVLSVPKAEILRREAEYKRQSEANPNRRGPKRKASASHDSGV
jgi:hypothetical protein